MPLRHQLPVYSPIPIRALVAAAASSVRLSGDARGRLAATLRADFGADDVLLCGSGTQALQLALEHAKRAAKRDALVALPAFSCFEIASAAVGASMPVVLYDLDPLSLAPDLDSLAGALQRGASVVVVAPLYGVPVAWDSLERLAGRHQAMLIEDAAQGHGASYRGKPLGALGPISTISFGRGKGWTGGAGGAVLYRRGQRSDVSLREPPSSRSLRSGIGLAAQWGLGRPSLYGLPLAVPGVELGTTVYHPPLAPVSISPAAAAAALSSRDASLREAERRRGNAMWIGEILTRQSRLRAAGAGDAGDSRFGGLRFPVLAPRGLAGFSDPDAASALGVAPSYPEELGRLAQLAPLLVDGPSSSPGAAMLARELMTLPSHSLLTNRDRHALAELIATYGS